ncbi:MAG: cysteine hydrolase family protein, partial [Bryobacteraceae bacterium]
LDAIPRGAPQIVVEKQQLDCFTNPHLRPLLEMLTAERYVVYGVVTELCVRCAAFGLLETGARVEMVTDAIQSLDGQAGEDTIHRFREQGGVMKTVAEVTS